MDDRPVTLGYASPGIVRVSPPAFPAMTVVGPFAAGAAGVVVGLVIWERRQQPSQVLDDLVPALAIAWGQAAGFLIAVKVRVGMARRFRPQVLDARPWWMSAAAGAGAVALWIAVVLARSWAIYSGKNLSDGFTYIAGLCVEGAYFLVCAFGSIRHAAVNVEPVGGS